MARDSTDTRRRIVDAADALFYGEGLRSVSVDSIAERAGVTKRTLYYHFPSKDDLIAAYLEARNRPTVSRYLEWLEQSDGPFTERVGGMFAKLAEWARHPQWRGCGFIRAAAELAGAPGHPALAIAARHKKEFESTFETMLAREGIEDPAGMARQIMLLLDGAVAEMLIHHDPTYAESAGKAAVALLSMRQAARIAH